MATHQLFGILKSNDNIKYVAVDDNCPPIVIDSAVNYKTNAIQMSINEEIKEALISLFVYDCKFTTDCNEKRLAYMKEFLMAEKISSIDKLNRDFILGVDYELYNKDGKQIKQGSSSILALTNPATILNEIMSDNTMEYRKALIHDARIEIDVPQISRYGITCACNQQPYTLKLTRVYLMSSIGATLSIESSDTQINHIMCDHGSSASYHHCMCDHGCNHGCHSGDFLHNNFASHFITNATVGTTIIDQLVVPVALEIPEDSEAVEVCSIDLIGPEFTLKINSNVSRIAINFEMLVDNFVYAYSIDDITAFMELINNPATQDDDTDIDDDF